MGTGITGKPPAKPDGRAAKPGWNRATGGMAGVVGKVGTGRPGGRIIAHCGGMPNGIIGIPGRD